MEQFQSSETQYKVKLKVLTHQGRDRTRHLLFDRLKMKVNKIRMQHNSQSKSIAIMVTMLFHNHQ